MIERSSALSGPALRGRFSGGGVRWKRWTTSLTSRGSSSLPVDGLLGALVVTVLLVPALLVTVGCRDPQLGGSHTTDGESSVERALSEVQDAHGGKERWRGHSGVSFRYEATDERDESILSVGELAFWLDDYRFVWVTSVEGGSPTRLDLTQEDAALARELERLGLARATEPDADRPWVARAPFLLRSIRYLLLPPLSMTAGRWEIRTILAPPGVELPPVVEVVPLEPSAPLGACVWVTDPATHVLLEAVYSILKAPQGGRLFRVTFEDPRDEDGLLVAGWRVHRRMPSPDGDVRRPQDPFGHSQRRRLEEVRDLVRERISAIQWIARDSMQSRFPRDDGESGEANLDASGGGRQSPSLEGDPGAEEAS